LRGHRANKRAQYLFAFPSLSGNQSLDFSTIQHPKLAEHVSLSGADGDDAKNYEEKNVARAIQNAREAK
jgi:hypothetical protein